MSLDKPVLFFFSVLSIAIVLVSVLKAADPLCENLPPNEVFPFPHESNCSLYYECYNGDKTLLTCGNGLYYNEVTQMCDFPQIVGCNKTVDPLCEGLPADKVYPFPHESNCSLYYECYNGAKTLQSCPGDFYFNAERETCDFPSVSGCSNGDPQCANDDLDFLPHPENCTLYIECYKGDSYLMACPNGYWFDSREKKCVHPDDSDCGKPTTPPWTTPHPLCWGVRPGETVLRRYEGDCNKYWRCDGSQLTLQSCPNNFFFDEERQLCDFPEAVNCDDSTRTPDPWSTTPGYTTEHTTPKYIEDPRCVDQGISYWPHPAFCDRYIECYHDVSYDMACPNGLYFDSELNKCVNPRDSECGKTTVTQGPTTERPSDFTIDPDCPYPQAEGKLMPYPGDCTQFYECAEGEKVAMACPEGLWFSPIVLGCDYPYQAHCEWGRYSFLDLIYKYFFRV